MSDHIFELTAVGGIAVLLGYYNLYFTNILPKLKAKYTATEWKLWSVSAILTVISFLGIIVWYSFYEEMDQDLFTYSLIVFLIGAIYWSTTLMYQYLKNNKKKTNAELLALTLTTAGTIGILISIVNQTEDWLLITAGSIVVFHHLFFDNFYWYFVQN